MALPATATAAESTVVITSTRTIPAPPSASAKPGADKQNPLPVGSAKTALPYTMDEASNDLLTYYEAGTFPHAIVSMNENAGAQAANCKATVNNVKQTGSKSGMANASDTDTTAAVATATGSTANSGTTPKLRRQRPRPADAEGRSRREEGTVTLDRVAPFAGSEVVTKARRAV